MAQATPGVGGPSSIYVSRHTVPDTRSWAWISAASELADNRLLAIGKPAESSGSRGDLDVV